MTEQSATRHAQRLAARMRDPEFAREYKRARREVDQIDALIRQLDDLRIAEGISKAELARRTGRNPSVIRRLFTAEGSSPEIALIAQIAGALDADIVIRPHAPRRSQIDRVVA
jgi:ribosome-binding protein aMBF1 (putative translation factor)